MGLDDYIAYLEHCVQPSSGHVLTCIGVVFPEDGLGEFDAILEFDTGHKLCIRVMVERDERGHPRPWWYKFHFQDGHGRLVERWDYDPDKTPEYHRHKPPERSGRSRITIETWRTSSASCGAT